MKKVLSTILIVICICSGLFAQTVDSTVWDGKIYVKIFNQESKTFPDYSGGSIASLPEELKGLASQYNITKISPAFPSISGDLNISKTYVFEFTEIQRIDLLMNKLQGFSYIEYVEKVPYSKIFCTTEDAVYPNYWTTPAQSYHLNLVNACGAWAINPGNPAVNVAIVDNEFNVLHPDLVGKITLAYDVADLDPNVAGPTAAFDHGTHVAGIAGASTNNNVGIASLGRNISLMVAKASTDASGGTAITNGYDGIIWAVNNGADVVSCSWGGTTYSITEQNVVNWATGMGVLVVAAAGNDNNSILHYPAAYNNVFAVGNTDQNDLKHSSSCFGNWVDICAPGTNILSTLAAGGYGTKTGTSMATPMVSALCGLILSNNPTYSPVQITNCITSTAVNIDGVNPLYTSQLGAGRIDAQAAMVCSQTIGNYVSFTATPNNICVNGNVNFTDNSVTSSAITSWNWTFTGGVPATSTLPNPVINYPIGGTYSVTLSVTTGSGTYTQFFDQFVNVIDVVNFAPVTIGDVCAGSEQQLNVTIAGRPPFSIDYNVNGGATQTMTYNANIIPLYILTAPVGNSTVTITSVTSNGVTCASNAQYIFNTIVCCPNLAVNGDFEAGNVGFTNDNGLNCAVMCPGHYCVNPYSGPTAVWTGWNIFSTIQNRNNSLYIDGRANPATCNTTGTLTPFATPGVWFNFQANFASADWQQVINFENGKDYMLSFFTTRGHPGTTSFPFVVGPLNLRVRILDATLTPVYTSAVQTVPYTLFDTWQQTSFNIPAPVTVSGSYTVVIEQFENFAFNFYDYLIDDITLQAVNDLTVTATASPAAICSGTSSTISTVTNAVGGTYSWTASPLPNPAATTSSIIESPLVTTIYTVTVTDPLTNCSISDDATVTVNPTPTGNPVSNISTCAGTTISASSFSSTPAGATYTWTNSNTAIGLGASGIGNVPSFTATNSGTTPIVATITVTPTLGGCTGATFSYTITVNPLPTVSVSPTSATIISGGSVTITASGTPATYSWSPATGLSNPFIANPLASPTVTTTYVVTATNSYGCTSTASTTITVTPAACGICNEMAPSGTLAISPPQYNVYCITTPMTISGTVNINLSEVRIAPYVTITVPSGAILNINGSHLYSCTDMWQGIIVQPGGAVNIQYYGAIVPGVGLVKRSPCIEDAILAVDIPSTATVTNNPLTVSNATFNRNQTSIRISNYTTTAIGTAYPMSIVNSVFTSRRVTFTPGSLNWPLTNSIKAMVASDPLATPYIDNTVYPDNIPVSSYLKAPFAGLKPAAGIVLQKIGTTLTPATTPVYYEMKIGMPGVPLYNVFDNLQICINASDANFTCVNNIFQKTIIIQGGGIAINAQCKEISNNRLQVVPAAATLFINKFYDCGRSINSVNYFENIATYCEVRSTYSGAPPAATPTNYNGKYGFFVVTNRFNAVNLSSNKIYNIESPITFNANLGPYSLGGPVITGQYSGQVDINSNTMDRTLSGSTVVNPFIANAITVTNVISSSITPIPGKIVNINANTLTNVYRGIRASNWAKKDVKTNDNTITMVVDPFTYATTTPIQYGIVHTTNSAALSYGNAIINNTVTGPGITPNFNIRAIGASLCQNQVVRCNRVLYTYKGIEFQGSNPSTAFNHNDMTGNRYGFVLDNAGYIGPQGTLTSPSDNRWLGLPATWTGANYKTATLATTTASTAVSSELYVRNTTGVFNPNGSGYTATTYFLTDYFNNGSASSTLKYITTTPLYVACPIAVCCFGSSSVLTAKMEQVVQDLDPLINNVDQTRYINKNQIYRMLKDDPTLTTGSTILQNFYILSYASTKETFSSIEDDIVSGNVSTSQAKTDGIVPANSIEENYKTFFTTYLKDQTDSITTSDSINLVSIAQGCPFTDGAVVYQARALYNSIFMTNIVFEDNCESTPTREFIIKNEAEITTFKVNLYPNPTPGEFTLELSGGDKTRWNISITDIQGRVILSELSDNSFVRLKPDAENGVYLVHITNMETNETAIRKLVIQK